MKIVLESIFFILGTLLILSMVAFGIGLLVRMLLIIFVFFEIGLGKGIDGIGDRLKNTTLLKKEDISDKICSRAWVLGGICVISLLLVMVIHEIYFPGVRIGIFALLERFK